MSWLRRLRNTIPGSRVADEFDAEAQFHVEERTEELVSHGMPSEEARREAVRRLGNLSLARDQARDVDTLGWLADAGQDLRIALRMLVRNPGFALVVVLTLALGIGATTAVFSVVNAVLLRPLPFSDSDELVWIWGVESRNPLKQPASYPDFLDWKARSQTLDLVGYSGLSAILTGSGEPQRLQAELTVGNLFDLLGVAPALGTTMDAEGADRQEPLVILSYGLWRRTFNADPNVVGRHITLNGTSHMVTAVMPAGFQFPMQPTNPVDLWVPLERFNPALEGRRDARLIEVVGRLKSGATIDRAQAEMDVIASSLSAQYPSTNGTRRLLLVPALDEVTGDVSRGLLLLLAAVGGLLLIACMNVANLLLARTAERRQEIATRSALGAGRLRIARQLLIESVLVAGIGGFAGCVLAMWCGQALGSLIPESLPRAAEIPIDGRVLGFAVLVSVTTGLLFGLAPAWHAWKVDLIAWVQDGARTASQSAASRRVCDLLIVGEIAVAMILLTGAGLFMHSFAKLNQSDPAFDPRNILTFDVSWPYPKHGNPVQAFRELRIRLLEIPGVLGASTGLQLPDRGHALLDDTSPFVEVEGRAMAPGERRRTRFVEIQPGYFRLMGIPLVEGRDFYERDIAGSPRVTIINESLARAYFPSQNPIGRHLKLESWVLPGAGSQEIVGVARDMKHKGLDEGIQPLVYLPLGRPDWSQPVVVKTAGDPLMFVKAVREAVRSIDPDQPIHDVRTMEQRIAQSLARDRFSAQLLGLFSIFALPLVAVGLYGVLSYITARRTREVGIRMALGAEAGDVVKGIVGRGMKLVATGVSIGLAGAVALAEVSRSLLFDITATDPVALAAAAVILVLVALLACWIPARIAAQVDPVVALRH